MRTRKIKITYNRLLFILIVLMSIVMLLACFTISYYRTREDLRSRIEAADQEELGQVNSSLEDSFRQMASLTEYMATDAEIVSFVQEGTTDWEGIRTVNNIGLDQIYARVVASYKYISNIIIITETGNKVLPFTAPIVGNFQQVQASSFGAGGFRNVVAGKNQYYAYLRTAALPENTEIDLSALDGRNLFASNIMVNGQARGLLLLLVDPSLFQSIIGSLNSNNEYKDIYLFSENMAPVYASNPIDQTHMDDLIRKIPTGSAARLNGNRPIQSKQLTAYTLQNSLFGWHIMKVRWHAYISGKLTGLSWSLIFTLLLLLAVVFIAARTLSRRLVEPIRRLIAHIRHYQIGDRTEEGNTNVYYAGIQFNILFNILLIVILPVLIFMLFSYQFSAEVIETNIVATNKNLFYYAADQMDSFIGNKLSIAQRITFNDNVQKFVADPQTVDAGKIATILDEYLMQGNGMDELAIYNSQDQLIFTNTDQSGNLTAGFTKIIANSSFYFWNESKRNRYNDICLEFYVKIISKFSFAPQGYLHGLISELSLENKYRSLLQDQVEAFAVDQNGTIVSHADKNLIGQKVDLSDYRQENNRLAAGQGYSFALPIDEGRLFLIGVINNELFSAVKSQLTVEKLYIIGMIFFISLMMSYLIVYNSTHFLRRFHFLLEKFSIDNMDIVFPEDSRISELSELGEAFNDMTARAEQLVDSLYISTRKQTELERNRKDAEIIALQTQINPHFLYNTFDCITWMIRGSQKEKAVLMVTSLSEMFRYVTKSDSMLVPIIKEVEYVRQYVEIMKIKYEGEIDFIIDFPEEVFAYKTIKLSIQPLVENAINHGMGDTSLVKGQIVISCRKTDTAIIFTVTDNGTGIPADKLAELRRELAVTSSYNKVGLHNVQNRIRLLFGENYGVTIRSEDGQGTIAEVRIPIVADSESPSGNDRQTI